MKHEEYMKKAIAAAMASEAKGGVAIGAIVVNREGEVIGTGMSMAGVINDVTNHGDIAAIRQACKKLQTINLEGCALYSTLESCGMCTSAAIWANMDAIYFGAYATDVPDNPYELKNYNSKERTALSQKWDGSPIKIQGGILRQECKDLLKNYKNWQKVES